MLKTCYYNYGSFIISCVLFFVMLIVCLVISLGWESPLDAKTSKDKTSIEVSLPIIEWEKYTGLSKKMNDGIIE